MTAGENDLGRDYWLTWRVETRELGLLDGVLGATAGQKEVAPTHSIANR